MANRKIPHSCMFCGKNFFRQTCKGRPVKFCSFQCYSDHRTSLRNSLTLCDHCGKEFHPRLYKSGKLARYCSQPCYFKGGKTCVPIEVRLWRKVLKTDTCWLWTGSTDGGGYGTIGAMPPRKPVVKTHILSYELHYGGVPVGLDVCHSCDTPNCVRPDHLFAGTTQANMDDMVAKGRSGKGTLTPELAREIRMASGKQRDIAKQFGVSQSMVSQIKLGKVWSHAQPRSTPGDLQ